MIDPSIRDEVLQQLEQLTPNMQRRVADFATALVRSVPKGTPGDELLRFVGVLDPKDAKAMIDAIETQPSDETLIDVEDTIAGIYEQPHLYHRTIGEINAALYHLHAVWAKLVDRFDEYISLRCQDDMIVREVGLPLDDAERVQIVETADDEALKPIIDHWKAIDAHIGFPQSR